MHSSIAWPELDVPWAPTKRCLHLYAQLLGKLRVARSPAQPNWLHTALSLSARGITTGTVPCAGDALQATLDVYDSELRIERSDGRAASIPLVPARTVAEVYAGFLAALREVGAVTAISPLPQELADVTPLDRDDRPGAYDPDAVRRWFAASTAAAGVFDEWRSHFFGRTAIALWWGGFDLSLMLFSGKKVPAPRDRGYLLRYDLDAQLMNAGFYPGDDGSNGYFYAYVYPQPEDRPNLPVVPAAATWSAQLGEWVLPYAAVRAAADPAAELRAFLDAIYAVCSGAAGWDRAALSYDRPPRPRAR